MADNRCRTTQTPVARSRRYAQTDQVVTGSNGGPGIAQELEQDDARADHVDRQGSKRSWLLRELGLRLEHDAATDPASVTYVIRRTRTAYLTSTMSTAVSVSTPCAFARGSADRTDLKMLGQTTQVGRSTLAQVRAKIASLREQNSQKVTAKNYDFNQRLAAVRATEEAERAQRREDRKRKRDERREGQALGKIGLEAGMDENDVKRVQEEQQGIEAMMGFGGFGGKKKR